LNLRRERRRIKFNQLLREGGNPHRRHRPTQFVQRNHLHPRRQRIPSYLRRDDLSGADLQVFQRLPEATGRLGGRAELDLDADFPDAMFDDQVQFGPDCRSFKL
jgi:hypothetical protein